TGERGGCGTALFFASAMKLAGIRRIVAVSRALSAQAAGLAAQKSTAAPAIRPAVSPRPGSPARGGRIAETTASQKIGLKMKSIGASSRPPPVPVFKAILAPRPLRAVQICRSNLTKIFGTQPKPRILLRKLPAFRTGIAGRF